MALILCLETATPVCSVALCDEGRLLGVINSKVDHDHATQLTVYISRLFEQHKVEPKELSAVAASMGPGSYTGLRIGISAAKGLCYALGIPLIAVATLQSMVTGLIDSDKAESVTRPVKIKYCPMIDARRMEVYYCLYDRYGKALDEVRAEVIHPHTFAAALNETTMVFFGSGAEKIRPFYAEEGKAVFVDGFEASASHMVKLAEEAFRHSSFADLAYFEPFYLKDFIAGTPRVKGLRA